MPRTYANHTGDDAMTSTPEQGGVVRGFIDRPTDLSLGEHELCEGCYWWFPVGHIEFYAGKFRCAKCREKELRWMQMWG